MAPDLNSVPPSPRPPASSPRLISNTSMTSSRRTSQQMPPPNIPLASTALNILPSNQPAVINAGQPLVSPSHTSFPMVPGPPVDNTGVGTGPGPLRHPRPLTAADLHLQLEKEQEAVVNRLTRELSMLRAAQNASVVSNSSSTSAGFLDTGDHSANHILSGPNAPTPSQRRHHRSSSSTSNRSITAGTSASTSTAGWTTSGIAGSVASSIAPLTADRTRPNISRQDPMTQSLSRQNSINSSRRSGASSPALIPSQPSSYHHGDYFPPGYSQRPSFSQGRETSMARLPSSGGTETDRLLSTSVTSVPTTGRYEEAAYHRHELEIVKRENEALKRKIRDLERTLRERRQSDASRTRSGSVSTTASVSFSNRNSIGCLQSGSGREQDKEGEGQDDGVRVGESAMGGGLA